MFNDALELSAQHIPMVKELLGTDDDAWYLRVEWPSVLRREDATYQTTWLNLHNAGVISLDTYMEKIGIENVSEELDRIRDNMTDPITAAVMGKQLGEIAHQTLNRSLGIPPWGYVIPKIAVKATMTPQQEGNLAENFGWGQGSFGNSIGPQDNQGEQANEDTVNAGRITGKPYSAGSAVDTQVNGQPGIMTPPTAPGQPGQPVSAGGGQGALAAPGGNQAPAPMMTTDNNQGAAPTSQPGSGATSTSAKGAVKHQNQIHGR